MSKIGFEAALDAMAANSKAALAADRYADWCLLEKRFAFPAEPETIVRCLIASEAVKASPATLARRVVSIARAHAMLSCEQRPAAAPMVHDQLKSARRRGCAQQRQATALRLGAQLDPEMPQGFMLSALLQACGPELPGLRDAALLSIGYDAGLRVSELVAIEVGNVERHLDGSGTLAIPFSKTDQEGRRAFAWISPESLRRLGAWLEASAIEHGPVFRRIAVTRRKPTTAQVAATIYTVGQRALSRQAVNAIYRKVALAAVERGLIELPASKLKAALDALTSHSLRIGLTHDLFAAGEDGIGIAQTLRWRSPSTALRYGRKLGVRSGVASRVLGKIRS